MRVRKNRRVDQIVLAVFAAAFSFTLLTLGVRNGEEVSAASLSGFDPGYIISDYQMGNYNSMSEAEIQSFLTAKNPCSNTNYNYYQTLSANKNYVWHWANGHFVCLSEEKFGDGEVIGSGQSAAHIIWQAAQDYRINPQVLLVLLQKETGLITDPIPNNSDYRKATGYGCPDTAPCSSEYYGFKNQVRKAASLFRTVLDGGWTNYPLGNNYIQYNPNSGCGGSVVNIRSRATSALYRYTPYQPNAETLAAGYGTAYCGAYGNRNFYLFFEDWFGGITGEGLKMPESSPVVEGTYIFQSALNTGKVLDLAGGTSGARDGTNIQLYENNWTDAQKWRVQSAGDGTYVVVNPKTGKVLDVAAAGRRDGTNIQLYSYNGSCAQRWVFVRNNDGTYTMHSACSALTVDVSGASTANGANVQIWTPNGTNAQRWRLKPVQELKNNEYIMVSGMSDGIAVDIAGGVSRAVNGTNIQIYERNNTDAQKWRVTYGADGYYTIINPATGKALEVAGASVNTGANVQLYEQNGSCAQKWQIVKVENGLYTAYSACSGLAMDVKAASQANGTNIRLYPDNKAYAQKWKFILASTSGLEGTYAFQSALNYNKVLDVTGGVGGARDGTNIQLYDSNGTDAQKWRIQANGDGTYTVVNPATGRVLDVAGAGVWNGTNVQLYGSNGTCAQRWMVTGNSDGTYTFYSACSGLALDVAGARIANGTNIQLYAPNNNNAQKWKLRRL